jgi:threonine aldolase
MTQPQPTAPRIDLRSDTVTRPSAAMRRAMAEAEVGDDVLDHDPTVARLEARTAELLGKDAALYFPSGTMANQAAVWLHTRPGTEIVLDSEAHILAWESAGAAALAGVQVRPVRASGAVMSAADLRAGFRAASRHAPVPSLVCVENTHNGAGGKLTSVEELAAIREVARERGLPVHMDGARLWNAAAASGTSLADFARCADTVMVAFSKALGAPIGAALALPASMLEQGWLVRKRLGGGMRQAGIIAAGALYGLEHNRDRLGEDHAKARAIAERVDGAGGARVVHPDSNIVMVDLPAGVASAKVGEAMAARGILISVWSATRVRLVTHLDVSAEQAAHAGDVLAEVLRAAA